MNQLSIVWFTSTINNQVLLLYGHDIHFNYYSLCLIEDQNIQPFLLKSLKSGNNEPDDNDPN